MSPCSSKSSATLTPFYGAAYYTDVGEAKRQAVNRWIRTSKAFDGVIDFDAATQDPSDPNYRIRSVDEKQERVAAESDLTLAVPAV